MCEAAPEEADSAYERALQASRATPAEASESKVQAYGMEAMSVTTARRRVRARALECLQANSWRVWQLGLLVVACALRNLHSCPLSAGIVEVRQPGSGSYIIRGSAEASSSRYQKICGMRRTR